ncbi:helix-turn-helix domain-containing protein [Mediterraneibacter hominis]|uniref:helix-turn-helix domain-containing protein n=1 Tax=Mediterraneibacter hominis TaxID=2763054 RepID=UPI0038CBFD22
MKNIKFSCQLHIYYSSYIKQIRMENAKELLRSKHLQVKEVASAVGYIDAHLFSKTFREYTGLLSNEYAKRC